MVSSGNPQGLEGEKAAHMQFRPAQSRDIINKDIELRIPQWRLFSAVLTSFISSKADIRYDED